MNIGKSYFIIRRTVGISKPRLLHPVFNLLKKPFFGFSVFASGSSGSGHCESSELDRDDISSRVVGLYQAPCIFSFRRPTIFILQNADQKPLLDSFPSQST
jgi:hypothetical protein